MPSGEALPSRPPKAWRLDWRQVWVLYSREVRAALRDRSVVVNSILIPLLLYPFLLWAGLSLTMVMRGESKAGPATIAVKQWPEDLLRLRKTLETKGRFKVVELGGVTEGKQAKDANAGPQLTAQLLRNHNLLVSFEKKLELPGSYAVKVQYNSSIGSSALARREFVEALENYREGWIKREAQKRGVGAAEWQGFWITSKNVASKQQLGAFILGLVLPAIFAVMVASGCFYPAVDTLAGERERGTWETLLSTGAQRGAVIVAKYLHVVTFGSLAGLFNLTAVLLTAKPIVNMLGDAGDSISFQIPLTHLPLLALTALLLAAFMAAGMMIFAVFARTFKEGQSMITPFYMVVLIPIVLLQTPSLKLSVSTAWIPVANQILLLRSVLRQDYDWSLVALTTFCSLLVISLILALAAYILHFEEVATGSYQGNLFKFLRSRVARQRSPKETIK